MDGIHDTGGRQGFGPVRPAPSGAARSAPFGARWEARVFACVMGLGGVAVRSSDQFRHAIERVRPDAYLTHGYYGRWLGGLETLVLEAGLLDRAAIDARAQALGAAADAVVAAQPEVQPARPPSRLPPLQRLRDAQALPTKAHAHALRPLEAPPAFAPGDQVRTRSHGADGHTRLPAYARGRVGTIVAWHDGWVYPDTNAHQLGEHPQHLYTVAFAGTELWGEDAEAGVQVMLDLFEPYLSAAAPRVPHAPQQG